MKKAGVCVCSPLPFLEERIVSYMRKQSDAMQENMPKEKTVPVRKSTLILLFCLCGVLAV